MKYCLGVVPVLAGVAVSLVWLGGMVYGERRKCNIEAMETILILEAKLRYSEARIRQLENVGGKSEGKKDEEL